MALGILTTGSLYSMENPSITLIPKEIRNHMQRSSAESILSCNFAPYKKITIDTDIQSFAYSPDGSAILIGCKNNRAYLIKI